MIFLSISPVLYRNYIRTAWRKARRQKIYTFINIAGMVVGLTCCLLLFLWIQDELSYDRFHAKADRIFRVEHALLSEGKDVRLALSPAPLAPALQAEFSGIERTVRLGENRFQVVYKNSVFVEPVFFADQDIFEVFTLPLVMGNPKTALQAPDSVVISEKARRRYFGEDDPIGKVLTFKEWKDFKVTGVFKDLPRNSHVHFDFLAPFRAYASRSLDKWGISNYHTYILAGRGFDPRSFAAGQAAFVRKYQGQTISPGLNFRYLLQPLTRIHLYSHSWGEIEANGDIGTLLVFSAVALLILLIACFNYINFASASYAARTREVGIRKANGAHKGQIIAQFLGESVLVSLLALIMACALAECLLPTFNSLVAKSLHLAALFDIRWIGVIILLTLTAGLMAGSYPALFLSSVPPGAALHGSGRLRLKASTFRNVLVIVQFAASTVFLIATLVIASQMGYVRDKRLGLDKEHVINVPLRNEIILKSLDAFKTELARNPSVLSVSASAYSPGRSPYNQNYWREGMSSNEYPAIRWIPVDHDFIRTLGLELAAGRDFSRDLPTDAGLAYILNETAAKEIWANSPLGRTFKIVDKGTVIGIVKDFHYDSLHQKIEPLALYIYPPGYDVLAVRIRPGRTAEVLDFLGKKWAAFAPGTPFEYSFLDEAIDGLYQADKRLNRLFFAAAAASILVASLGLLGLAALATRRRTKEIGIRRVLGGSVTGISVQLSKEFLALVALANFIAWPVSYYALSKWLQGFAYRTALGAGPFLVSTLVGLMIALLMVGTQTVKAASANPAESLRFE